MTMIRRRDFLATGAVAAGVLALGPDVWRKALAATTTRIGESPYGALQPADANGLQLPPGFRSRELVRGFEDVPGIDRAYRWHRSSDGQATYATADGGWVLVSNSETTRFAGGGVSSLRFGPDGNPVDAYRICVSNSNCAGGPTPWGTWLTCEEMDLGQVYECDPLGVRDAVVRPAMGTFAHEAVCVDPDGRRLYMTEDKGDGCLYRFTPTAYPDLSAGVLEVASVDDAGAVTWARVPDPSATIVNTRRQVPAARKFNGGEGIWFDSGFVYFTSKGDQSVWTLDVAAGRLDRLYDPSQSGDAGFLQGPDNITVAPSGDLYVCEDNGNDDFDIVMISPDGIASPFLRADSTAGIHEGSEFAGVIFSPDGTRMYFASQRAHTYGAVYEVVGPFRAARPPREDGRRDGEEEPPPGGGGEQPPPGEQPPTGQPPAQQPPPLTVTPPPGDGVATIDDVDAPGLKLTVGRRVTLAALRKRGLPIAVQIDEAATVTANIRVQRGTVPGARGSQPRPRLVTLGVAQSRAAAGRRTVTVRLTARQLQRLQAQLASLPPRARQLRTRLTVQAIDAAGNATVATRELVIAAGTDGGAGNRTATRKRARARRGA